MVIAYNYAITAFPDEECPENVTFDVYYFTKGQTKMNVVRIRNAYLNFYLHRLPGYSIERTLELVRLAIPKTFNRWDVVLSIRRDLRDSCYNILEAKPFEYVEIASKSPSKLQQVLAAVSAQLLPYFRYIDPSQLDPVDRVVLRNIETPFRNTAHTTSIRQASYWLSRTFSIPFVGYIEIDETKLIEYGSEYLAPLSRFVDKVYTLNANPTGRSNDAIRNAFKQWEAPVTWDGNETSNIILASYDIETYNRNSNPNPKVAGQYIFCIGLAFFHLNSGIPFERFSIMTKDVRTDPVIGDRLVPTRLNVDIDVKAYRLPNEYIDGDPGTVYVYVKDETDLVHVFIRLLNKYSPHIVSQFNGWAFDCQWINSRVEGKPFYDEYLQVFSTYHIEQLKDKQELSHLMPKYRPFALKLEGKVRRFKNEPERIENAAVRAPIVQSLDVMKLLLKADPKRFSATWKLDYMLATYHIKNPYTKGQLSKSGLTIDHMFELWDEGKDLYEIAFYCMQDAWICTTLIIERFNVVDKLAMSTITFTSFEDSVFRADGHRVSCLNAYFAAHNHFAYMDEGYEHRIRKRDENWKLDEADQLRGLGHKYFDPRKVMGGAVRCVHARRATGIVAADYSSMYPSQYRSGNVASSTRVDNEIIEHPERFGLEIVYETAIVDQFGPRKIVFMRKSTPSESNEG